MSPGNSFSLCRSGPKKPVTERTFRKDSWFDWPGVKLRAAARATVVHMGAGSSLETRGSGQGKRFHHKGFYCDHLGEPSPEQIVRLASAVREARPYGRSVLFKLGCFILDPRGRPE